MKLKYIEERIPPYFIFGTNKDGYVDLASKNNDTVISHISKEDAKRIIKERDDVIKLLHKLSENCGKNFKDIWYNMTI